jgi:hypothetical protein
MPQNDTKSQFTAQLFCPESSDSDDAWAFVILPKSASAKLPRRGRTTIEGTINTHYFQALLEPDGQLSHWLKLDKTLLKIASVQAGDTAEFEIMSVDQEPEPELPTDLQTALTNAPEAQAVWNDTTTIARLDWIHWITSAKQSKTRTKRINDACDMLASGKRRVCCFDPSGYYSKALSAPKAVD